jgi:hypothetical protein
MACGACQQARRQRLNSTKVVKEVTKWRQAQIQKGKKQLGVIRTNKVTGESYA